MSGENKYSTTYENIPNLNYQLDIFLFRLKTNLPLALFYHIFEAMHLLIFFSTIQQKVFFLHICVSHQNQKFKMEFL